MHVFQGNTLYGYSLKLIDMIDCLDNQNVDGAIYHICAGSGKLRYVANNVSTKIVSNLQCTIKYINIYIRVYMMRRAEKCVCLSNY